jgi:hypothetical protein
LKDILRTLANQNTEWGNDFRRLKLAEFVKGWINYFIMADMKRWVGKLTNGHEEKLELSIGDNGRRLKRDKVCREH